MGTAENLKALEVKIKKGGTLTKEDTANVKAVTGEAILGYPEAERRKSKSTRLA